MIILKAKQSKLRSNTLNLELVGVVVWETRSNPNNMQFKQERRQTARTTSENNDMIGLMRKNNRASPAARTIVELFDVPFHK